MHIPNVWVQCHDCYRWHLKIVPCVSREYKDEAVSFPCYWATVEIMVAKESGKLMVKSIRAPYIVLEVKQSVLAIAYTETLKYNVHLLR